MKKSPIPGLHSVVCLLIRNRRITMKIGCPTEIKLQEFRVGMTPNAAREATAHGHEVIIQAGAGLGAGFADEDYIAAGARICETGAEIYNTVDMIVKVKEPQPHERALLREG